MKNLQARQTHKQEPALVKSTTVRAFWKLNLEPIDKDLAEGQLDIRIDSPDCDERKRAIIIPCIALLDILLIRGTGQAEEIRKHREGHVQRHIDLSLPALPFNVIEFFLDLRKQIERQWKTLRQSMKEMPLKAQGIATARFKHELTPEEEMREQAVQMHIIDPELKEKHGQTENRGSVRQLRQSR